MDVSRAPRPRPQVRCRGGPHCGRGRAGRHGAGTPRALKFGLAIFPTEYSIEPTEIARLAEERDFESLFFPEHTHIPVSRDTPYPGGGELPREYSHIHDPFVALSMAAAATQRLLVGTGLCLIVERDPIVTAKEVASLDRLSGGRFLFGIGAGWNEEEMANHGTDPRRRFTLMRERVEAMKAIWSAEEAEYHGEHVDFDPIWCWPKPIQQPHPPILVGGSSDGALRAGRRDRRRMDSQPRDSAQPAPRPHRRAAAPRRGGGARTDPRHLLRRQADRGGAGALRGGGRRSRGLLPAVRRAASGRAAARQLRRAGRGPGVASSADALGGPALGDLAGGFVRVVRAPDQRA